MYGYRLKSRDAVRGKKRIVKDRAAPSKHKKTAQHTDNAPYAIVARHAISPTERKSIFLNEGGRAGRGRDRGRRGDALFFDRMADIFQHGDRGLVSIRGQVAEAMHELWRSLEQIWILPRRLTLDTSGVAATVPMLRGVWGAALYDLDHRLYRCVFHEDGRDRERLPCYILRPVAGQVAVDWIVIGRPAIRRDAWLLLAWGMAMERGLDAARVPFRVLRMQGLRPDGTVAACPRAWRLSDAVWPLAGDPERTPCRLSFWTPLSLLRQGELIPEPTLKDLVVRAGWRIGAFLPRDQRQLWHERRGEAIEFSRRVPERAWQGQRLDLERYSARQGREFRVPGVCGHLDLPTGPGLLWPLLAALQWLHLGKSTIVGLGQLTIEPLDR